MQIACLVQLTRARPTIRELGAAKESFNSAGFKSFRLFLNYGFSLEMTLKLLSGRVGPSALASVN